MRTALVSLCGLALAAALCEQLFEGGRFERVIRFALGLKIAQIALSAVKSLLAALR